MDLAKLIQVTRDRVENPSVVPVLSGFNAFKVFEDRNDVAVVARKGRNCMIAFAGTDFANLLDITQLYAWDTDTIGGCTFRGGIWSAYLSTYYDEFVASVNSCMVTSPRQRLIIGGHSQGGAIAVVAAADLARFSPTVVTIGAVRSLVEPCASIVPENHYRFVQALDGSYDYWTMIFETQAMHVGHTIYLDPMSDNLASYVGLNDNTDREPNSFIDINNHDPDLYVVSLTHLVNSPITVSSSSPSSSSQSGCNDESNQTYSNPDDDEDDEGIRITGWESGHFCNDADECAGHSCLDYTCFNGWPKQ